MLGGRFGTISCGVVLSGNRRLIGEASQVSKGERGAREDAEEDVEGDDERDDEDWDGDEGEDEDVDNEQEDGEEGEEEDREYIRREDEAEKAEAFNNRAVELAELMFQLSILFASEEFKGGQPKSSLLVYFRVFLGFWTTD